MTNDIRVRVMMEACYSQEWRRYHTLHHVRTVKERVQEICKMTGKRPKDPEALDLAIDLHDLIYVPGAPGCEAASGLIALSFGSLEAQRLIELTAGHKPDPDDIDGCLICDADLFELGSDRYERYKLLIENEAKAWMEYCGILFPDEVYRRKRIAWLQSFLWRDSIYTLDLGMMEMTARRNLADELIELEREDRNDNYF